MPPRPRAPGLPAPFPSQKSTFRKPRSTRPSLFPNVPVSEYRLWYANALAKNDPAVMAQFLDDRKFDALVRTTKQVRGGQYAAVLTSLRSSMRTPGTRIRTSFGASIADQGSETFSTSRHTRNVHRSLQTTSERRTDFFHLTPEPGWTPDEYKRWLLSRVRRGDVKIINALRDPGQQRLLALYLRNALPKTSYTEVRLGSFHEDIVPKTPGHVGREFGSNVFRTEGRTQYVEAFRGALREANVRYPIDNKPWNTGGPRPDEALFAKQRSGQWTRTRTAEGGIVTGRMSQFDRLTAALHRVSLGLESFEEAIRKTGISTEEARKLIRSDPELRQTLDNVQRNSPRSRGTTSSHPYIATEKGETLPYAGDARIPFGKFSRDPSGRSTLDSIPAYYLAALENIEGWMAVNFPVFYRNYMKAKDQPWFREKVREYEGLTSGRYSPRDRQPHFDPYRPSTWDERMMPRFRDEDMWMQGKGVEYSGLVDLNEVPISVNGKSVFVRDRVQYYSPDARVALPDYRARRKAQRRMKEWDPERHESLVRKDFWELLGGVPGDASDDRTARIYGGWRESKGRYGGLRGVLESKVKDLRREGLYREAREYRREFVRQMLQKYSPMMETIRENDPVVEAMSRVMPTHEAGAGGKLQERLTLGTKYGITERQFEILREEYGELPENISDKEIRNLVALSDPSVYEKLSDVGSLDIPRSANTGFGFKKAKRGRHRFRPEMLEGELDAPTLSEVLRGIYEAQTPEHLDLFYEQLTEQERDSGRKILVDEVRDLFNQRKTALQATP